MDMDEAWGRVGQVAEEVTLQDMKDIAESPGETLELMLEKAGKPAKALGMVLSKRPLCALLKARGVSGEDIEASWASMLRAVDRIELDSHDFKDAVRKPIQKAGSDGKAFVLTCAQMPVLGALRAASIAEDELERAWR